MHYSSTASALAHAFQIPLRSGLPTRNILPILRRSRPFSSTTTIFAKDKNRPKVDRRITLIRYYLQHPLTPRPLRFSRLRSLRHWTIHRAWQLYQAKTRLAETLELERQYNSMRGACEELRKLAVSHVDGEGVYAQEFEPGLAAGGRLYRQAVTKKGNYGRWEAEKGVVGGVPIEYARAQTDTPPRNGWDHEWTR